MGDIEISSLREYKFVSFHTRSKEFTSFLQQFASKASNKKTLEALTECIRLCRTSMRIRGRRKLDVMKSIKLQIGVRENDIESIERQVFNIVVVGDMLTSSLEQLLCICDPHYEIYAIGRQSCLLYWMKMTTGTPSLLNMAL